MPKKLKRESKMPLYKQLKEQLMTFISENLKPGDMLPVESEIEKKYGVSRVTVRKTIEELVTDGIVVKYQGRGTFVQSKKIIQDVGKITSWTEEMRIKGKKSQSINVSLTEISPTKKLAKKLQLNHAEKVIRLKRTRLVDGEPIVIMINYLCASMIPDFIEKGLTSESLYETLEKEYGIIIEEATELVKAREATDLEALELNLEPYSPVFHITRLSYLDGLPFEVVEMTSRPDRYEYHIQLSGRNKERVILAEREDE
ncbi:GntR family transcriptional regulator [Pullulanibacillus camelliae]|uniref:GntR family transcriptional regulator n=1 Tax=Pullulanibacillus camelliae TaxID=1707096 RepID=A0A8J2YFT2_9BACL|nr:GntR family transcriptional regulator [Pullulanibacillus camelliae]GGE30326.1 GntR family transcriptional regulator [Pullulanibacillus camelliae]